MLKNVELSDLEMGMFVHKMEGSWFDHPFWKANFLIDDPKRLELLKSSKLRGIIIDTAKGKDVGTPRSQDVGPSSDPADIASHRIKAISKRYRREADALMPVGIEQEINAAQAIASKATDKLRRAYVAARRGRALDVKIVESVVDDILASVRRNPHAFSGLMRCKLKNELMFRHALSVSALMVSLARKMKRPPRETLDCGLAGLLLDIGINYLPENLDPLHGDFRNADPKVWQQHVILGHRALVNDDYLPQLVLDAVLQHHEWIDGGGFPNGLSGKEISIIGRMAAICDTFDFLLTQTSTTAALDPAAAIQRMKAMDGAFDEEILHQFIESVGLYPVGSFVRLSSGKLAMVTDEDHKDHTRPVVQVFYSLATKEQIKPYRIELSSSVNEDWIVEIADLAELDLPEAVHLREMLFLSTYRNAA